MKIRKTISLILCSALLMALFAESAAVLAADEQNTPFIDNEHWIPVGAQYLTTKLNGGGTVVCMFYRTDCFNSGLRRVLVEEWMDSYGIDVYGVDVDRYGMPGWVWEQFPNEPVTLPVICIVDESGYHCFTAKDSMRAIQEQLNISLKIADYQEISFRAVDERIYGNYAKGSDYVQATFLTDRSMINEGIAATSDEITAGLKTGREKLKAIYDWVTANIYYDVDMAEGKREYLVSAEYTYYIKVSVCAGFANLTAALCHAAGIPCRAVTGFATGIGTDADLGSVWTAYKEYLKTEDTAAFKAAVSAYENHAWNEAYIDGEWVILDTTWGCNNEYYATAGGIIEAAPDPFYYDPPKEEFYSTHLFWREYPEPEPIMLFACELPEEKADGIVAASEIRLAALYDGDGRFLTVAAFEIEGNWAIATCPLRDEAAKAVFFFARANWSPVWAQEGMSSDL